MPKTTKPPAAADDRDVGAAGPDESATRDVPRRELTQAHELRAMAHPVRLALLETLAVLGEATATELAERVGQSPANCSWHLRQLAHYGLIEEAGGGSGRQRPWKFVPQSVGTGDVEFDDEPEVVVAMDALFEVMMGREVEAWQAWRARRHEAPQEWFEASFASSGLNFMTVEELAALREDVQAVVDKHIMCRADRADPARRPPGAEAVRFVAWAVPARAPSELPSATAATGDTLTQEDLIHDD